MIQREIRLLLGAISTTDKGMTESQGTPTPTVAAGRGESSHTSPVSYILPLIGSSTSHCHGTEQTRTAILMNGLQRMDPPPRQNGAGLANLAAASAVSHGWILVSGAISSGLLTRMEKNQPSRRKKN